MSYIITDKQLEALQGFSQAPEFSSILETVKGQPEEESVGGWNAEDMQTACQMHDFTLSDEDANLVLKHVEHRFDASLGMDWDTIWYIAGEMEEEGKITLLDWKENQQPT